jgi:Protein of unknown function (DUF3800)
MSKDLIATVSSQSEKAAAITRSLFCGLRPGENRVAVFVAYSDESGIADPGGEFVVAGYVAEEKEWPWVASAWQSRVLDGSPKLPYLHMVDIRSTEWRDKHAIAYSDAEDRVSEAVRVLYSMGAMSALGSVIKRRDLQEVIHSKFKRRNKIPVGLDEPDYFCFIAYAWFVLGEVQKNYPKATKVNFIVSKRQSVTEHYKDFVETMKDWLNNRSYPKLASMVGDLIPASMEDHLPLQAADVLCWHMQRYYTNNFDRGIENRMWSLLKERGGHLHEWDRSDLEEMAIGLKL